MAQIFSRASDTCLRAAAIGVGMVVVGGLLLAGGLVRSDYLKRVGSALAQPVPFSHRHHAGELGIDCRYCHHPVEETATAGYPPTHTCVTCHSQLWTSAGARAPVRELYRGMADPLKPRPRDPQTSGVSRASLVAGEPGGWRAVPDRWPGHRPLRRRFAG